MKTNARAAAAALLLGGMLGVPASPVFSSGTVESSSDTSTDGAGNTYTSTRASALSTGMSAPKLDVGSSTVLKGTVQYTNSTGTSDAFSVGTSTSINASVSASSTPDYSVNSIANFGIGGSKINQVIGTSGTSSNSSSSSVSDISNSASTLAKSQASSDFTQDTTNGGYWWWNRRNNKRTKVSDTEYNQTKSEYETALTSDITKTLEEASGESGTISGVFKKIDGTGSQDGMSSNEVTVKGIGADNQIAAASSSVSSGSATSATGFNTGITKLTGSDAVANTGAGTASGSAAGNVSTTASANANSSQYVSSFAQAY